MKALKPSRRKEATACQERTVAGERARQSPQSDWSKYDSLKTALKRATLVPDSKSQIEKERSAVGKRASAKPAERLE